MKLKEIYEFLSASFKAIEVPTLGDIKQNGTFINFLGTKNISPLKDVASFAIVIASNTLTNDTTGALVRCDSLREKIREISLARGESVFKELKSVSFANSTLYLYAFVLEFKVNCED